jgi:alpha-tubulin suppressor-like RCC1 family protein
VVGTNRNVYCWGLNTEGRLGIGSSGGSFNSPQQVSTLSNVGWIVAGGAHTCILMPSGNMWCWGRGTEGQLGTGDFNSSDDPLQVTISNVAFIAAGGNHSCAIMTNLRDARCWGSNSEGQLGIGSTTDATYPMQITGFSWGQIEAGYRHTCGILEDGTGTLCWGRNVDRELGSGGPDNMYATPQTVSGLQGVTHISAGGNSAGGHTCAVVNDDRIWCWGNNRDGQVSGSDDTVPSPRMVNIWTP